MSSAYGATLAWASFLGAAGAFAYSRSLCGRRRRKVLRASLVLLLIAGPLTFVFTALALSVTYSAALNVLGIALTLVLAVIGTRLETAWRGVIVGVVMPSRVPFFTEVRRGLADSLSGLPATIVDEYDSSSRALEDLTDFMPTLRRVMKQRPDFLLLACPTATAASSAECVSLLTQFAKRGGAAFFIENGPASGRLVGSAAKRTFTIESDSNRGAEVLADYLSNAYRDHNVVILAGPAGSHPAVLRSRLSSERFPEAKMQIADVAGWSMTGAAEAAMPYLQQDAGPLLFICGNDSMALGVAKAIQDMGRHDAVVAGYDGVRQVLAAIAEVSNPIVATLRTPASSYGSEAGARMRDLLTRKPVYSEAGLPIVLSVDESHLVTRHNVPQLLAEIWS